MVAANVMRRLLLGRETTVAYERSVTADVTENVGGHALLIYSFSRGHCRIGWRRVGGKVQKDALRSGRVYLVHARSIRAIEWQSETEYVMVYIESRLADRVLRTRGGDPHRLPQPMSADETAARLARRLRSTCRAATPDAARAEELAIRLVARAATMRQRSERHLSPVLAPVRRALTSERLQRIRRFVASNLGSAIGVDDLARLAGVSTAHFSEEFRRATGLLPSQFIIRCRIERAHDLLSQGSHKVQEVARMVGYPDAANFSERFKAVYGYRPKSVRADLTLRGLPASESTRSGVDRRN